MLGDTAHFRPSFGEDGLIFGTGVGCFVGVLAGIAFVDSLVESSSEGFPDALGLLVNGVASLWNVETYVYSFGSCHQITHSSLLVLLWMV